MAVELTLFLTPEEAAYGVTKVVDFPSGPANVRIPPVQDGSLIKVPADGGEVLLRIRLRSASPPAPSAPQRPRKSPSLAPLLVLGALGVLLVFILVNAGDDSSSSRSGPAVSSPSPFASYARPTPDSRGPYSGTGGTDGSRAPVPRFTLQAPEPTPYRAGTCLNGTLPHSTTPVTVRDVDVVDCSASDAHYRVIQTFYGTTDMDRCRSNPDTEYSFSSRTTRGGTTINSYVYCLVGLGAYARG